MRAPIDRFSQRFNELRAIRIVARVVPASIFCIIGILASNDVHIVVVIGITGLNILMFLCLLVMEERRTVERYDYDELHSMLYAISYDSNTLQSRLNTYVRDKIIDFYKSINKNSDPPPTMRVSVYTHNRDLKKLSVVARFSSNAEYDNPASTPQPQAENSGVVGRAWIEIKCEACIEADPETDWEAYRRVLIDEWKMDESHVNDLAMRSRHLRARRIEGGEDGRTRIGVVLIETINETLCREEKDLFDLLAGKPWET